jgi:hypothetical protein
VERLRETTKISIKIVDDSLDIRTISLPITNLEIKRDSVPVVSPRVCQTLFQSLRYISYTHCFTCFHYIRIQETGWHALFMWWHSVPKQESWVWKLYVTNTIQAVRVITIGRLQSVWWPERSRVLKDKVLVMIIFVFYKFSVLALLTDHWDTCFHRYLYLNMYPNPN